MTVTWPDAAAADCGLDASADAVIGVEAVWLSAQLPDLSPVVKRGHAAHTARLRRLTKFVLSDLST